MKLVFGLGSLLLLGESVSEFSKKGESIMRPTVRTSLFTHDDGHVKTVRSDRKSRSKRRRTSDGKKKMKLSALKKPLSKPKQWLNIATLTAGVLATLIAAAFLKTNLPVANPANHLLLTSEISQRISTHNAPSNEDPEILKNVPPRIALHGSGVNLISYQNLSEQDVHMRDEPVATAESTQPGHVKLMEGIRNMDDSALKSAIPLPQRDGDVAQDDKEPLNKFEFSTTEPQTIQRDSSIGEAPPIAGSKGSGVSSVSPAEDLRDDSTGSVAEAETQNSPTDSIEKRGCAEMEPDACDAHNRLPRDTEEVILTSNRKLPTEESEVNTFGSMLFFAPLFCALVLILRP